MSGAMRPALRGGGGGGQQGGGRARRPLASPATLAVLFCALAFAGPASAAPPAADGPGGAVELGTVTAENGAVTDLSAVIDPAEATPDAVPRCLGGGTFERAVWAWVPAAEGAGRVTVEVTPQSGTTAQPDLAVFVQPPGGTRELPDVREPSACDGRELLGDDARGDGSSAATVVVGAGRPLLVQVAWRAGDASAPLVVSAHRDPLTLPAAPAGDEAAGAPAIALGAAAPVPTAGATLGPADPAEPWCPAPATVFRRIVIPRAGFYAVAAGGDAVTVTAFADPLSADSALGCADAGDGAGTGVAVRAAAAGTLWVRVGVDHPEAAGGASLATSGPFPDAASASGALAGVGAKAAAAAPVACTTGTKPKVSLSSSALSALRARRSRVLSGTVRQPCDAKRARAKSVRVGVAKRTSGRRCAWLVGRRFRARPTRCGAVSGTRAAAGVQRWRVVLPKRLPTGTFRIAVQLRVARHGAKKTTTMTATTHTITIKKKATR
jgi:hypothetical protein